MGDLPDCILLRNGNAPLRFSSHPHRMVLLPDGMTTEQLGVVGHVSACFLIDADCTYDTLNGRAFSDYMAERVPILIHTERLRDLKPFRKRRSVFKARGYAVEVLL